MKIWASAGIALLAFFTSVVAPAAPSTQWEFEGSSFSSILVTHESDGYGDNAEFFVGTSVGYFVTPQWELGLRPRVDVVTSNEVTAGSASFRLTAGPTYNFSEDTARSIFATAQAGVRYLNFSGSGHSYLPLAFFVGIGKRFAITDHVTWTPELDFSGNTRGEDGSGFFTAVTNYELAVFQFSILL